MTSNQINYHKLLEDKRHNRAVERETKRANLEQARNTRRHTDMQDRYNQSYITHLSNSLRESGRHNLATEAKDLLYLNRTMNETERHNRANEYLTETQINKNYQLGMSNVTVAKNQLVEQQRHNSKTEQLTHQNNIYNYSLGVQKLDLENLKRADSVRETTQRQLLQSQQLYETERHNKATEDISGRQTTITALTNTSQQINQWYKSLSK